MKLVPETVQSPRVPTSPRNIRQLPVPTSPLRSTRLVSSPLENVSPRAAAPNSGGKAGKWSSTLPRVPEQGRRSPPSSKYTHDTGAQDWSGPGASAQDVVHSFFDALNDRDISTLCQLVSEDCLHHDLAHEQPAFDREGVRAFYQELVTSLAANMKFVVEEVTEGDSHRAGVTWHVRVEGSEVPCVQGLSFYRLNDDGKICYVRQSPEHFVKVANLALTATGAASPLIHSLGPLALPAFWSGVAAAATTVLSVGSDAAGQMLMAGVAPVLAAASPSPAHTGQMQGMAGSARDVTSVGAVAGGSGDGGVAAGASGRLGLGFVELQGLPSLGLAEAGIASVWAATQALPAAVDAGLAAFQDSLLNPPAPSTTSLIPWTVAALPDPGSAATGNVSPVGSTPTRTPAATPTSTPPWTPGSVRRGPTLIGMATQATTLLDTAPLHSSLLSALATRSPSSGSLFGPEDTDLTPSKLVGQAERRMEDERSEVQRTFSSAAHGSSPQLSPPVYSPVMVFPNMRTLHRSESAGRMDTERISEAVASGGAGSKGMAASAAPCTASAVQTPANTPHSSPVISIHSSHPATGQLPPPPVSTSIVPAVGSASPESAATAAAAGTVAAPVAASGRAAAEASGSSTLVPGPTSSDGPGSNSTATASAQGSVSSPPSKAPATVTPQQSLSGIWGKDPTRCDIAGYEAALDLWQISGMQKATARLIEGLEISHTTSPPAFVVHFLTIVPHFKVTEAYVVGGSARLMRRDLRIGSANATTEITPSGAIHIKVAWGVPMAGGLEEVYEVGADGALNVTSTIRLGDRSASTLQVYVKQAMTRSEFLKGSERKNGNPTDILRKWMGLSLVGQALVAFNFFPELSCPVSTDVNDVRTCSRTSSQGRNNAGGHPCRQRRPQAVTCALTVPPTLLAMPLFPSRTLLSPTGTGTLTVYEPKYLQMFEEAAEKNRGCMEGVIFGHVLSAAACPAPLLSLNICSGQHPPIAVAATVRSCSRRLDGTLELSYEGGRRLSLFTLHRMQPYHLAAAEYLEDEPSGSPSLVDELEVTLYSLLQEVAKLSSKVAAAGGGGTAAAPTGSLPPAVHWYAPPPPTAYQPRTSADWLVQSGSSAGRHIAQWRRRTETHVDNGSNGSMEGGGYYGVGAHQKQLLSADPYQVLREGVGKSVRQELFSFAAAGVLDLGFPEQWALLSSTDCAARLQWTLQAVEPYVRSLRAHAAMTAAVS